jgi:tetratricopeptide (TPR) repeat protein
LGIYNQKNGAYQESVRILSKGVECFPENEQLNLCLGVSHMNLGAYKTALPLLLKFQHSKQAVELIANCYNALNDFEKGSAFQKKLESMS